MKVLLVTFSDNADHQDTLFGMYEMIRSKVDATLLAIKTPKVSVSIDENVWLVDCPKRPGITRKTFDLPLLMSIVQRIRKEQFDYIYFESLHMWNLPIMIFGGKAKIYHVIHEVIPHEGDSQEQMVDLMNKAVCKFTDYIVLRNQTYVQTLADRYGFPVNHIIYSELWRRFPKYTAPMHTKNMLFFGRMNPYKGIDNLLAIAKACPDVHFSVIGKADSQIESIVNELSSLKNVTVKTGYVSDDAMHEAFVQADWIILPYNSASQSGVIIDAYKYSRPVVAFNVGAIQEQIRDGISGYLIPAGDNAAFVEKIKEVMSMPEAEYDKMSYYAYEYGCKKYATCGAAERFLALFGTT